VNLFTKHSPHVGFSSREVLPDNASKRIAKIRLLTPALLVGALALFNYITDRDSIHPFQIVSRNQFLPAIAGFLTYRLSLFISEIVPDLKFDDVMGILPGSVAEGYRQMKGQDGSIAVEAEKIKVFFVTGPKGKPVMCHKYSDPYYSSHECSCWSGINCGRCFQ
jgi:hypothetical protein